MAVRETWVYPHDGSPPYLKGSRPEVDPLSPNGPAILPDLPDFVSPVDGKRYSGRAGLAEHNRRNNVINNEELKGLPPYQTNSDIRSESERRADAQKRKEVIINQVNKHYR